MLRSVENEYERGLLIRYLEQQKLPFTVEIQAGRKRSTEQNKTQRLWMKEISEQTGMSPEEARAFCKLTIGVPILRAESETFREKYDAVVRPLTYEAKLAIMSEPLDMPVTRLMSVAQKSRYLDAIFQHFTQQGIALTIPEERRAA